MHHQATYCPVCGRASLVRTDRRFDCSECHFQFYFNVASACAAFVEWADRVLVTIRRHEPAQGQFDLPGGFVEPYESLEQALRREVHEELNIELEQIHYLGSSHNRYPYKGVEYHTADAFFVAQVLSVEGLVVADDISDYRWLTHHELRPELFPFESIAEGVRMYRRWRGLDPTL